MAYQRSEVDLVVNIVDPLTSRLSVAANKTVNIYLRNADGTNGSAATLYTTPNLTTTKANPTTTDAYGRIDAWLDQGSYNIVVSGTDISTFTQPWEAMPASTIYNQHKQAVRAVGASNVTLATPGTTLDGVTLAAGNRILLTGQTTASQNGIWVWNSSSTSLTRPADFNSTVDATTIAGSSVYVMEGTTYASSVWYLTSTGSITIDTTSQTWAQRISKFYTTHTWTVGGALAVASGDTNYIPPMFFSKITNQTSRIVKARYVLRSGTGTTQVSLAKNGSTTSLASLTVPTTTPTSTTANITLADDDQLALVVNSIGTTPNNLTFTITIEHTVV